MVGKRRLVAAAIGGTVVGIVGWRVLGPKNGTLAGFTAAAWIYGQNWIAKR